MEARIPYFVKKKKICTLTFGMNFKGNCFWYTYHAFGMLLYFLYKNLKKTISKAFCDSVTSFSHNPLVAHVQNWNIKIHAEQSGSHCTAIILIPLPCYAFFFLFRLSVTQVPENISFNNTNILCTIIITILL